MPLFGSCPARITESGYNVGEKFYAAVFKLRVQIPSVETLGYGQIKSIHL
jgi:hypothetical protein